MVFRKKKIITIRSSADIAKLKRIIAKNVARRKANRGKLKRAIRRRTAKTKVVRIRKKPRKIRAVVR